MCGYCESKLCVKVAQRLLGTAGYYHTLDGQIMGFGIGPVLLQSILDGSQAVVAAFADGFGRAAVACSLMELFTYPS